MLRPLSDVSTCRRLDLHRSSIFSSFVTVWDLGGFLFELRFIFAHSQIDQCDNVVDQLRITSALLAISVGVMLTTFVACLSVAPVVHRSSGCHGLRCGGVRGVRAAHPRQEMRQTFPRRYFSVCGDRRGGCSPQGESHVVWHSEARSESLCGPFYWICPPPSPPAHAGRRPTVAPLCRSRPAPDVVNPPQAKAGCELHSYAPWST